MIELIRRILRLLYDSALIVAIILVILLTVPKLFGVETFAITSGSMEPKYPIGSIVFAVPTDPEKIVEGNVISFQMGSITATHRVIEVDRETESFITKGDANEHADGSPVDYERVIGKVQLTLPLLGYLTLWFTPKKMLLLLIPITILILLPSPKKKTA